MAAGSAADPGGARTRQHSGWRYQQRRPFNKFCCRLAVAQAPQVLLKMVTIGIVDLQQLSLLGMLFAVLADGACDVKGVVGRYRRAVHSLAQRE
jgi:hypothetical protein